MKTNMEVTADEIARAVIDKFNSLPQKRKPIVRGNGSIEWVPLSGVVAEFPDRTVKCLSLATGMKCLPQFKIPSASGQVLHDTHAEILALRGFNSYLLSCCESIVKRMSEETAQDKCSTSHYDHGIISLRPEILNPEIRIASTFSFPPFIIRSDIRLHLYCSEAPCGDSSMELVMAAQADATPWDVPNPSITPLSPSVTLFTPSSSENPSLPGRANFSLLSIVRRKPSRPDAPPTLSKSCSDKLSLKQCSSILSSISSLLVGPENAYLTSVVIPKEQLCVCASGFERAFGAIQGMGRMAPAANIRKEDEETGEKFQENLTANGLESNYNMDRMWQSRRGNNLENSMEPYGPYKFHPLSWHGTSVSFLYSKSTILRETQTAGSGVPKLCSSNMSALWTADGIEENIIGGILQGRRAGDPKGMSAVCRWRQWESACGVIAAMTNSQAICTGIVKNLQDAVAGPTYADLKSCSLLATRQVFIKKVQDIVFKGWMKNKGDEGFILMPQQ